MNPMQILKMAMGKMTPQQIINTLFTKNNNPMMTNLKKMADEGNSQGVETFARNLFKEQGRDFDKEFQEFMGQFKK